LLLTGSPSKADEDDHSYLPPWMRSEYAPAGSSNEKADPPAAAQPAVANAQLVKAAEPPSSNLTARVKEVKAKVATFVSNLFSKSVHLAKGE